MKEEKRKGEGRNFNWSKKESGLIMGEGRELQEGMVMTKIIIGKNLKVDGREEVKVGGEEDEEKDKKEVGEKWSVMTIYRSGESEWKDFEDKIRKIMVEKREESVIIGGDVRIGKGGGMEEVGHELGRKSRDKITNKKGKKLVNLVREVGGYFLNGATEGDREGEYTYIGPRGNTVIDYVIVNKIGNENVRKLRIKDRIDSDQLPVILTMERKGKEEKREEKKEEMKEERRTKIIWDKIVREQYKEKTEDEMEEGGEDKVSSIEDRWEKLKGRIENAMLKKEIKFKRRVLGKKDWWDKSCTKGKRKVKRIFEKRIERKSRI